VALGVRTDGQKVLLAAENMGESLPAAGDLIQIAARLASGAIPDETRRFLLFIGARLKKRELRLGVIITLRQFIELTVPIADDCEPLPALAAPEGCDVLLPDCKSIILLMLNHALDFMKRPQLV
jgi:hypothetical protein